MFKYLTTLSLLAAVIVLPAFANSGGGDDSSPFNLPDTQRLELTLITDAANASAPTVGQITSYGTHGTRWMLGEAAEDLFWQAVSSAEPGGKHHKAFGGTATKAPVPVDNAVWIEYWSGTKLVKMCFVKEKTESETQFARRMAKAIEARKEALPDTGPPSTS